ncbi:MAG: nucleotidyl transferase AbiEii/AbiGii toxin family protein [Burkholderiales bacterium]|nr:nucleotidyl transferase AbiEii/AbiGii toxin family protein [Burkholderiales bacterium]
MIPKQEIMALAAELQLQAHVVEKDYALGWFLAGISAHPVIGPSWVFKGGTCLKKCYFETYRFSEDLDFTLQDAEHLDEGFLAEVFEEVGEWVYDACGLQLPPETRKFEIFTNPRGTQSAQGRVGYRGPLGRAGDPPRIRLDLAADEVLVLTPVQRPVHHPYTDSPADGIHVLSYSFEEVFAEKMRALAERQRPRDLYDVVHLYRRHDLQPDRAIVRSTLARKCEFKGIAVPTYAMLSDRPERTAIEVEWEQMLAHQLPTCPPFQDFWRELPEVFEWLNEAIAAPAYTTVPAAAFGRDAMDGSWRLPPMVQAWGAEAGSLETIRFAAANRLCVQLDYTKANGERTSPTIEPYSVRRTRAGHLLLFGVEADTGESRSYRLDRVNAATVTRQAFRPRYVVELTASGPLAAPALERPAAPAAAFAPARPPARKSSTPTRRTTPKPFGSTEISYTFACPMCGKSFKRSTYDATLKPHKNKQGWPCPGRVGHLK